MARHKPLTRAELNAKPVTAPDVPETEHFYTCEECGQAVDRRRLGDVFHHEEHGHEPLPAEQEPNRRTFMAPMMPSLVEEPPSGEVWTHEIKYDGYRTQLHVAGESSRAFTRNGRDWTDRYQRLIDAAQRLPCATAVLDGEVIVQDEQGRCDFHSLRASIDREPHRLVFMAFDLLELDAADLRRKPLQRRRELLEKLLGPNDPASPIQFSQHVEGSGEGLFAAADAMGLEGIVSKRLSSRYRSGPSKDWLKIKCFAELELVVIGTERGDKAPTALLARESENGLEYAGGAMVTLAQPERDRFWEAVERLKVSKPPLPMKVRSGVTWLRPEMRVRVRTLRGEEMLRHATVQAIFSPAESSIVQDCA